MCQRSQISTRAHTALRRHERSDAAVEHLAKRVDDDRAHAGMALGERICPQQHHGARLCNRQWFAHAYCMRADQVDLQFTNLVAGNAHIAQFTHAGRDGISDLVARDNVIDHGARLIDCLPRVGRKQCGTALSRHLAYCLEREIISVDVECVQEVPCEMFLVRSPISHNKPSLASLSLRGTPSNTFPATPPLSCLSR